MLLTALTKHLRNLTSKRILQHSSRRNLIRNIIQPGTVSWVETLDHMWLMKPNILSISIWVKWQSYYSRVDETKNLTWLYQIYTILSIFNFINHYLGGGDRVREGDVDIKGREMVLDSRRGLIKNILYSN